jgi:hypothetical protein
MSDKPKFDPEKLAIADFKLIKGQVDAPEEFDTDTVKGYRLNNGFQLGFSLKGKQAKADLTIEVDTDSQGGNTEEAKALFHLIFIFKVDNLEELVAETDDKQLEVDPMLGSAIAGVSYSTARGILLTRLQGTVFQKFILPVINPSQLLAK